MLINSNFDSGNIEIITADDLNNIQLKLRKDNITGFSQWFYFRASGAKQKNCQFKISNAHESSYPEAWDDYKTCASYDRKTWFRIPTRYENGTLIFNHQPEHDVVYYAYFAPYSFEQHQNLIATAQQSSACNAQDLGLTLDGRAITLLNITRTENPQRKIWIIARQHAGETMAEWFIEGLLERLLDENDPVAKKLLEKNIFYVVPNMNVDGSMRGHLRGNAVGIDLNRAWLNPSLEKSPEVFYVREMMHKTGVDFFMDTHGDEGLPYVFPAGAELNPSFTPRLQNLQDKFYQTWKNINPDFQTEHGYGRTQFGEETLKMATNYIADAFDCLAFTLEMPFKDNANAPDAIYGWSPARAKKLAYSCLDAIFAVVDELR